MNVYEGSSPIGSRGSTPRTGTMRNCAVGRSYGNEIDVSVLLPLSTRDGSRQVDHRCAMIGTHLTVTNIAWSLGLKPKAARDRLRRNGDRAPNRRWPTVVCGSPEHHTMVLRILEAQTR